MNLKRKYNLQYLLSICGVAALGGLLFGYDTSVIAGVIEPLKVYFQLTPFETGWAVSNVIIGCILGALVAGSLADQLGRKKALLLSAILFTISAVYASLANSLTHFVIGRIIGGVAVGIASTVSPMYMSEASPKDFRARAISMQQFAIVFGQIVIFYVNYKIASLYTHEWLISAGWRYMVFSEIVPCILFLVLVFFIPESPRWNALKGNDDDAFRMLAKLSNPEHAKNLLKEIKASIQEEHRSKTIKVNWNKPINRYILVIGCMIAVLQQVTGVNAMMYYAPTILQQVVGGNLVEANFQTIWIGVAQIASLFIAAPLHDRIGRLPLMKIGSIGSVIGLLATSFALYTHASGYFALFGMMFFMFFYGISWGVGCWILISEIFPNDMRSNGMGIAVGCMWVGNFIVAQTFPMINENPWLQEKFHGAFPMWIFAACCVFCYWFIRRYVPETKGVSLEHMRENIEKRFSELQKHH